MLQTWFLRDFAFVSTEPICHIFNAWICTGIMSSLWKRANVVLIPRVRPPKFIHDDLIPISLTPTLSKLLELLVDRRLLPTIINKFDSRQFGALIHTYSIHYCSQVAGLKPSGRSKTHALIAITHMWLQALDDRNSIRVLFVNYAKAFDHVDYLTVLAKHDCFEYSSVFVRWMHSFLLSWQQSVRIASTF
jgi:hypothetical protein